MATPFLSFPMSIYFLSFYLSLTNYLTHSPLSLYIYIYVHISFFLYLTLSHRSTKHNSYLCTNSLSMSIFTLSISLPHSVISHTRIHTFSSFSVKSKCHLFSENHFSSIQWNSMNGHLKCFLSNGSTNLHKMRYFSFINLWPKVEKLVTLQSSGFPPFLFAVPLHGY